jgi:hypothetical protein
VVVKDCIGKVGAQGKMDGPFPFSGNKEKEHPLFMPDHA